MRDSRSATLAGQTRRTAKLTWTPMLGHILLLGSLGTEETMKRRWQVRRETVECPDAQGRWDEAYQAILLWSLDDEQGHEQAHEQLVQALEAVGSRHSPDRGERLREAVQHVWSLGREAS